MEDTSYTNRGNVLGFCNGYSMRFRRVRNSDGRWIWRCTNKNCGGTATSTRKDDLVEENKHHGHVPDTALVEVRKRISNAVLDAERNRDTPVRSLVGQAFNGLSGEVLFAIGARETLTARLTRCRNKDIGAVNRVEKSDEWPDGAKQTSDGRSFLHYDSETFSNRFVLRTAVATRSHWTSTTAKIADLFNCFPPSPARDQSRMGHGRDVLLCAKVFQTDLRRRILHSKCRWNEQLLSVHLHLLQSKKEEAYRQAFLNLFGQFSVGCHPRSVMMDFETAAKNAFQSCFPDAEVKHCLFHLFQNFYKRVQKEKIVVLWEILDVKILLRCLPAIAFLPIDETEDGFEEIQAAKDDLIQNGTVPQDSVGHLNKLFSYFERNYVRRPNGNAPVYLSSLWNMYERTKKGLPRTNNGVENWNKQFNEYFHHDKPPLAEVIFKLRTDEEKTRQKIEIRNQSPLPRVVGGNKSQRAIFSGSQIKQLVINYGNSAGQPRLEFLVSIGAHLEKYHGH